MLMKGDCMSKTLDIVLISCAKCQHRHQGPAKDHYYSSLFQKARKYAEESGASWYILSPKYGLLEPDRPIEWYDVDITHYSAHERRQLSQEFVDSLLQRVGSVRGKVIEIHAGKKYIDNGLEDGLRQAGAIVRKPLAGLGHGERLRWYINASR